MSSVVAYLSKHPGYRLFRHELELYRDTWKWFRGRVDVPTGARLLPYPAGRVQMVGMLSAVMSVEMVCVHLLLPVGTIRLLALVISLWGLAFMWAALASERVYPSYVTDDELVVGGPSGTDTELSLTVPIQASKDTFFWQRSVPVAVTRVRFYSGSAKGQRLL
ncbi:hypothetical protein ACUY28_00960 [Corynebacterium sanguinis]|uniref:Uncharacterized protein n=1 Tax=Corynebacterium sanguinis TaxID=2594913 RepID=A0A6C1U0S7_9CORY|nr:MULTISPECIES: hypothetical protein [Corynebacterium]MBA4505558.1 hypothetical protein [Corynebacterium sanguinis]MCT1414695.1 hypothetical protein [Corynebacterium sanguinis]MCT1425625.1 hypothetical protein [Corynebacterium sanguinis]MCT1498145.1 hypothetical protein [Corynebacterium sanguinis]MCT1584687.1 hypothetical protein [Corynebacterium sanguinis]